jgi:hypothetical protein
MPDRIYFKQDQYVDFYEEAHEFLDGGTFWFWQIIHERKVVVESIPFDTKQEAFDNLKLAVSVATGALNTLPKVP